jgi:hypothetical protein
MGFSRCLRDSRSELDLTSDNITDLKPSSEPPLPFYRNALINMGDTWWGLYRFHCFSKSAPYPPVPSPGSRGGRAMNQSIMIFSVSLSSLKSCVAPE